MFLGPQSVSKGDKEHLSKLLSETNDIIDNAMVFKRDSSVDKLENIILNAESMLEEIQKQDAEGMEKAKNELHYGISTRDLKREFGQAPEVTLQEPDNFDENAPLVSAPAVGEFEIDETYKRWVKSWKQKHADDLTYSWAKKVIENPVGALPIMTLCEEDFFVKGSKKDLMHPGRYIEKENNKLDVYKERVGEYVHDKI